MSRRAPARRWLSAPLLLLLAACSASGQLEEPALPRPTLAPARPLALPSGLELPVELADAAAVGPRFERECAACHGLAGRGDGPRAPMLRPPPADLTDAARMRAIAPSWLHRSIVEGKGGMPSWGYQFDRRETWDLTFWAWSQALAPRPGDEARFSAHCQGCHDGAAAAGAAWRLDHASRAAATFDEELAALSGGPHASLATVGAADREAALRWSWTHLYRPAPPPVGAGGP